ncbi:MAG TPA: metallopeptidase TldD-related protein [Polyangia bacterium]|nr:metallopeptidase TldD-related protein [Polyangia bacterium]
MSGRQGGGRRIPDPKACQRIAEQMLAITLKAGADGAEVLVRDGTELEVKVRLGEPELIKEAGSRALGLRVLKDQRAAVTYTSDLTTAGLERLARDSVELAALAEPDPIAALPAREEMARDVPELDLWDEGVLALDVAEGIRRARAGEAAALAFDKRVTNSDGAVFGRTVGASAFATSAGFSGSLRGTHVSFAVEPLCDDADGKKRNGSFWTASRFANGLADAEGVGAEAARRTVAKLGARKIPTGAAPVIFSPDAGRGLLGQLAGVMSGGAVWRRSSYLAGREGTPVASPLVEIVDDPLLPRGPGSRPFDGEGLASRTNVLVAEGVLRTFLCDVYAARKLARRSTGSASRGIGGSPHVGVSNLILRAGRTPAADIEKIDRGLYVTDLMGFGFNPVTGDYSQGAGGFWIERGERAFPVTEITVSSNFDELWKGIDAVGDDPDTRTSIQVPTFRVSSMMIAGT